MDAYWGTINEVPAVGGSDGFVLTWSGDSFGWAAPTGGDTITEDLTLYVTTAGNDTTGDGSSGAPWATIDKAFDYLADKIIFYPAIVTIDVEGGNYPETATLAIGHLNGEQIQVKGDRYLDTGVTLSSMSGGAKAHTIVLTTANPSYYTVNDYVLVHSATGGTNPKYVEGAHKVTNVTGTSVTMTSVTDSATNASGAVTVSVVIPKVRLNRKLQVRTNILNIEGVQVIYSASTLAEMLVDLGVTAYTCGALTYCVVCSTNAQYGIGIGIGKPGYWQISACGIANLKYGIYMQSGSCQFMFSVANGNGYGSFTIGMGNFYAYGDTATIIGNSTYGIILSDMSLYRHGATPVVVANGTNYSPAEHSSGSNGSYMG